MGQDDIVFALAKAGSNTADAAVSTGSTVAKVIRNFDPTSIVGAASRGNFFKNLSLPEIPLTSSKLFHTPDVLTALKHVDLDDLIPKNTGDLVKGLGKNVSDSSTSGIDELTESLAKATSDPDVLKGVVNNISLKKLKGISDDIAATSAETAAKKSEFIGDIGSTSTKKLDEFTEATGGTSLKKTEFKNTDEMADSLKSSTRYSDEIGDTLEAGAKKADGVVDDVAEQVAKDGRWAKLAKTMDKYNGVVSFGIFGAFMLSRHLNGNAPWSTAEFEEELADPVDAGEIEQIEFSINVEEIVKKHASNNGALQSDAFAVAVVAATVAFMSM